MRWYCDKDYGAQMFRVNTIRTATDETNKKEAVLTSTHNLCFEQKYKKKISEFLSEIFQFLVVKCFQYIWIGAFS